MLENKIERKESIEKIKTFQKKFGYDFENPLVRDDETGELELKADYNRLSDFILTKLHGNYEFTIPKETFMEKVFNKFTKEGKEYSEAHKDDYRKDEDLHIQLKIVPGFEICRTGLGPETPIASIFYEQTIIEDDPENEILREYQIFAINTQVFNDMSQYDCDLVERFSNRLRDLEFGSRDRWVKRNMDKFKSVDDARDYYRKNWHLLTDVDYYKENLIRTSVGGKIQKDQSGIVTGKSKQPDGTEQTDIVYTKPRLVLTVNGKEVKLLSKEGLETLNRINTYEKTPGHEFKSVKVPAKMKELAKDQGGAVKRHVTSKVIEAPLTTRQADSLIALIFRQAQRTVDRPIGR